MLSFATSRKLQLLGLALVWLLGLPALVSGQAPRNHLYDRFRLTAGFAAVFFSSNVRVDPDDAGEGTPIDAEDVLGLESTVGQPRFGFAWQISRRHQIEVDYLFARRSAEKQLDRTFVYGDETFNAGLNLKTDFDSDLLTLAWRWAFHAGEGSKIGMTVGVGGLLFKSSLEAFLSVNDQTADVAVSRSTTGPVAGIGGFGRWRLGPRWYLDADLRGIFVPIDRFDAKVLDGGAAITWFATDRLGIEGGWGFNVVRIDISPSDEARLTGDFSGFLKYGLQNLRLGGVLVF